MALPHISTQSLPTLLFLTLLALFPPASAAPAESPLHLLAQPDHFALVRHALAPGTGDPGGFDVNNCATQWNPNDAGRAEALGRQLRAAGIGQARVFSSQWCRCLDTARLLGLGEVVAQPLLNSFFGRPERRESQLEGLQAWLGQQPMSAPTVLVTHQVVITGLTGVYPASGEVLIVKREDAGPLTVVARVSAGL